MKQIAVFHLTRLLAAASLEFHNSVLGIVSAFGGVVASLGNLTDQYRDAIELQQRAANKERGLSNTQAINEKDEARDAFLSRFFKAVSDFARSPIADEKAAAQTVNAAVSRFRGLTGYERNKQTGEIRTMLIALRQPAVWDAADVLGLHRLIEQIETANTDFETEMNIRIEAEAQKEKLNFAEQRKATEAVYAQIVQKINAVSVVQPTDETDNCIDRLNALIDEYNRTIASMRAGGTGNESRKKKENPEQPETEN